MVAYTTRRLDCEGAQPRLRFCLRSAANIDVPPRLIIDELPPQRSSVDARQGILPHGGGPTRGAPWRRPRLGLQPEACYDRRIVINHRVCVLGGRWKVQAQRPKPSLFVRCQSARRGSAGTATTAGRRCRRTCSRFRCSDSRRARKSFRRGQPAVTLWLEVTLGDRCHCALHTTGRRDTHSVRPRAKFSTRFFLGAFTQPKRSMQLF